MRHGKHICRQLKAVRRRIADENGIPLEQRQCTHTGPCSGTCPYCEAETRYLEQALAKRLTLGKAATVAGLSLSLAACGGGQQGTPTPLVEADAITETPDSLQPLPEDAAQQPDTVYPEVTTTGIVIPVCGEDVEVSPATDTVDDELVEGEASIFQIVDEEPMFPGGVDSMYAFIRQNLRWPETAQGAITGKVYVQVVVEPDGTLTNHRILRDIGGGCGEEALRVVKLMPRWSPGKIDGKPVRTLYNMAVNFSLQ